MLLHAVAEPFFFGRIEVAARAAKWNCRFHVEFDFFAGYSGKIKHLRSKRLLFLHF